MNALELADKLEADKFYVSIATLQSAAVELRRLHEVNQELLEALHMMFASIPPYTHDGTPTIPDKTVDKANAAINKAKDKA